MIRIQVSLDERGYAPATVGSLAPAAVKDRVEDEED